MVTKLLKSTDWVSIIACEGAQFLAFPKSDVIPTGSFWQSTTNPWKLHAYTHTSHLIGRYISPIPFFPFGSELRRRDRALLYRDGSPFPPPSFCSRFLIVDCYGDCQELFFIHLLSLSHSLVKNYVLAWFSCQKRFYLLYFWLSDLTWWWLDLAIKEI